MKIRPITDKQKYFLYSKGYPAAEVDKLDVKAASLMIAPYYHKDLVNYEYDDEDGRAGWGYL